MSLQDLERRGLLEARPTSADEVRALLAVADRDIADAQVAGLSLDARFASAYNAVMTLARVVLRCNGYRTRGEAQHKVVFDALRDIAGPWTVREIGYYDACRKQRNAAQYDLSGIASESQAKELLSRAVAFRRSIEDHVKAAFPQYLT